MLNLFLFLMEITIENFNKNLSIDDFLAFLNSSNTKGKFDSVIFEENCANGSKTAKILSSQEFYGFWIESKPEPEPPPNFIHQNQSLIISIGKEKRDWFKCLFYQEKIK